MILRDDGKIISETEMVADTFNNFSVNLENTLNIDKDKQFVVEAKNVFDPVLKAIKIALILAFLASKIR